MFEKVNPSHPDKIADRIAGAIVDLAYDTEENPEVAVEVLIGHGKCYIIGECSVDFLYDDIKDIVYRIAGKCEIELNIVRQDKHLSDNQKDKVRCGDNGIFRGMPTTQEQKILTDIAKEIYLKYQSDGKYIIDDYELTICQSKADKEYLKERYCGYDCVVNPLGDWTGGLDVDSGATNRKLGSDMGDAVTGGGLHGKTLSKADVSVNIFAHILAQATGEEVEFMCAIGDEYVNGIPYAQIVEIARDYINRIGGFEKFAEWGLIR